MPDAPVITRRTKTSVDARCSLCPGVMVLWADRDAHSSWHTPAAPPAPPAGPPTPVGYRPAWTPDMTTGKGWTAETGKPKNADGTDRPENATYGTDGATLLFNRGSDGKPYTADIKGLAYPVPALHAGWLRYRHDPIRSGMWPCSMWFRPLDGGAGEIDILETFAAHLTNGKGWPVTAMTLHDTGPEPNYNLGGRAPQAKLPQTIDGSWHDLAWRLTTDAFSVTLDGVTATITRPTFDARYGAGRYLAVFGDPGRLWYPRITLQAGGDDGGPIDPELTQWRLQVQGLQLYVPVA